MEESGPYNDAEGSSPLPHPPPTSALYLPPTPPSSPSHHPQRRRANSLPLTPSREPLFLGYPPKLLRRVSTSPCFGGWCEHTVVLSDKQVRGRAAKTKKARASMLLQGFEPLRSTAVQQWALNSREHTLGGTTCPHTLPAWQRLSVALRRNAASL